MTLLASNLATHQWSLSDRSHSEGHRSFQLHKNWEGKGRAVARVLSPPGLNVHRINVDEKTGICITTHVWGGLTVIHLFSSIVLWCLPMVRECFLIYKSYSLGFRSVFNRSPAVVRPPISLRVRQRVSRLRTSQQGDGSLASSQRPFCRRRGLRLCAA